VDRVPGEEAGQHGRGDHVVDRRDLDRRVVVGDPQQGAADAAEAVDSEAQRHGRVVEKGPVSRLGGFTHL
jgi:hypothetical protein